MWLIVEYLSPVLIVATPIWIIRVEVRFCLVRLLVQFVVVPFPLSSVFPVLVDSVPLAFLLFLPDSIGFRFLVDYHSGLVLIGLVLILSTFVQNWLHFSHNDVLWVVLFIGLRGHLSDPRGWVETSLVDLLVVHLILYLVSNGLCLWFEFVLSLKLVLPF